MLSIKKISILIGACSILTACASGYLEPSSESSHANFTFKKTISAGVILGGEPTVVTYQTYMDSACAQPVPVANFSALSKKEKTLRFDANRPQRMVVNFVRKTGDFSGSVTPNAPTVQHNCIGMVQFTPKARQTYEFSVNTTEETGVCVLNVIDTNSGESPPDLVRSKQEVCVD